MHRFLRAVGFSNINTRQDLDKLLGIIMDKPNTKRKATLDEETTYTEMSMEFARRIGITIRGEYDKLGFFHLDHYYPYLESTVITSQEDISFNKRVDTNAYTGMCDDIRLGISMIFYLQNVVDYIQLKLKDNTPYKSRLSLSGLSLEGCIILGINMPEETKMKRNYETYIKKRLIAEAKNGDQDAIDSLTIDEIDLTTKLSKRIMHEDLYSIVESTFIPYGSESDNYSIVGTIINWTCVTNSYTNEEVYELLINCNGLVITVCINKKDLLGEPMIGRRFKGVIWMQGHVDFPKLC